MRGHLRVGGVDSKLQGWSHKICLLKIVPAGGSVVYLRACWHLVLVDWRLSLSYPARAQVSCGVALTITIATAIVHLAIKVVRRGNRN